LKQSLRCQVEKENAPLDDDLTSLDEILPIDGLPCAPIWEPAQAKELIDTIQKLLAESVIPDEPYIPIEDRLIVNSVRAKLAESNPKFKGEFNLRIEAVSRAYDSWRFVLREEPWSAAECWNDLKDHGGGLIAWLQDPRAPESDKASEPDRGPQDIPDYLIDLNTTVAFFGLTNKTPKQKSKFMETMRKHFAGILRAEMPNNAWRYDLRDVKLIAATMDKIGFKKDGVDPSLDQIRAAAEAIRRNWGSQSMATKQADSPAIPPNPQNSSLNQPFSSR
jgi:hypothetical protein